MIHIQDAHCNYAAQHKIAEIVEYLNREYGVSVINLEGGVKGYDLSVFSDIPDNNMRKKVSDYFVKEGLVNGAEYFAANNPGKVSLWGVEDTKLYMDNLNVYRSSLDHKEEIDNHLRTLNHILSNLKSKIYSKDLLQFDINYGAYKANNMEFREYLSSLMSMAGSKAVDIKSFPNIDLLNRALGEEGGIDFKKANKERDDLIDRIQKRLSRRALEELVARTVGFRSENISQKDFYSYLILRAGEKKIDAAEFPELMKYTAYISVYAAIDKSRVMEEVEALENETRDALCRNDDERQLSALSKDLSLLKNIFGITLTREDYKYYKANEESFGMRNFTAFIEKNAPLYGITAKLDDNVRNLDQYRKEIERFYEYSLQRDAAFLKNLRITESSILVTGGFHTENLAELFKKNGISYVSIMPTFKNHDKTKCPYFSLLAGKPNGAYGKIASLLGSSLAIATYLSADPEFQKITHGEQGRRIMRIMAKWRAAAEKDPDVSIEKIADDYLRTARSPAGPAVSPEVAPTPASVPQTGAPEEPSALNNRYDAMDADFRKNGIDVKGYLGDPDYFTMDVAGRPAILRGPNMFQAHARLDGYLGGKELVSNLGRATRELREILSGDTVMWTSPENWHSTIYSVLRSMDPAMFARLDRDDILEKTKEAFAAARPYKLSFDRIIVTANGTIIAVGTVNNNELTVLRDRLASSGMPKGAQRTNIVHISLGRMMQNPSAEEVERLKDFTARYQHVPLGTIAIDRLSMVEYYIDPIAGPRVKVVYETKIGQDRPIAFTPAALYGTRPGMVFGAMPALEEMARSASYSFGGIAGTFFNIAFLALHWKKFYGKVETALKSRLGIPAEARAPPSLRALAGFYVLMLPLATIAASVLTYIFFQHSTGLDTFGSWAAYTIVNTAIHSAINLGSLGPATGRAGNMFAPADSKQSGQASYMSLLNRLADSFKKRHALRPLRPILRSANIKDIEDLAGLLRRNSACTGRTVESIAALISIMKEKDVDDQAGILMAVARTARPEDYADALSAFIANPHSAPEAVRSIVGRIRNNSIAPETILGLIDIQNTFASLQIAPEGEPIGYILNAAGDLPAAIAVFKDFAARIKAEADLEGHGLLYGRMMGRIFVAEKHGHDLSVGPVRPIRYPDDPVSRVRSLAASGIFGDMKKLEDAMRSSRIAAEYAEYMDEAIDFVLKSGDPRRAAAALGNALFSLQKKFDGYRAVMKRSLWRPGEEYLPVEDEISYMSTIFRALLASGANATSRIEEFGQGDLADRLVSFIYNRHRQEDAGVPINAIVSSDNPPGLMRALEKLYPALSRDVGHFYDSHPYHDRSRAKRDIHNTLGELVDNEDAVRVIEIFVEIVGNRERNIGLFSKFDRPYQYSPYHGPQLARTLAGIFTGEPAKVFQRAGVDTERLTEIFFGRDGVLDKYGAETQLMPAVISKLLGAGLAIDEAIELVLRVVPPKIFTESRRYDLASTLAEFIARHPEAYREKDLLEDALDFIAVSGLDPAEFIERGYKLKGLLQLWRFFQDPSALTEALRSFDDVQVIGRINYLLSGASYGYLESAAKEAAGQFDPSNPLHLIINYASVSDSLQRTGAAGFSFKDYISLVRSKGTRFIKHPKEDELAGAQLRGLAVEGYHLWSEIAAIRRRAQDIGLPVIILANQSYGSRALMPISDERGDAWFVFGMDDVRIVNRPRTKIGSTEHHFDPGHPKFGQDRYDYSTVLSDRDLEFIVKNKPVVLVVDASDSVDPLARRSNAHIPDAYKGWRNLFMAVNHALTGSEESIDHVRDDQGVFETIVARNRSLKALEEKVREMAEEAPESGRRSYSMAFWYPGNKELWLRRNHDQLKTKAQKLDASSINGPTLIFVQSAIEPDAIPQKVREDFIRGDHRSAFFDDDVRKGYPFNIHNYLQAESLAYREGSGIVFDNKTVNMARAYFREFAGLAEPGRGPGGGSILEMPNNSLAEARALLATEPDKAKALLERAVGGSEEDGVAGYESIAQDFGEDTDTGRAARASIEEAARLIAAIGQTEPSVAQVQTEARSTDWMALRAAAAVDGVKDLEPGYLSVVVQCAPAGEVNEVTGYRKKNAAIGYNEEIEKTLKRNYNGVLARSIIGEGVTDEDKLAALLGLARQSIESSKDPDNGMALLLLPSALSAIFWQAAEKASIAKNGVLDGRYRLQFVDQGDMPDLVNQFILGIEILDYVRSGARPQEAKQSLINMLAAMADGQDPADILKKLFEFDFTLRIRKIDWRTVDEQRKSWEAVITSL